MTPRIPAHAAALLAAIFACLPQAHSLHAADISEAIRAIRAEVVNNIVSEYVAPQSVEEVWDKVGLTKAFEAELGVEISGSYDPAKAGMTAADFYDGDHLLEPGIKRLLAPIRQQLTEAAGR